MKKTLLGAISITHLSTMMGPLGIYQHAKHSRPRLSEGYCTDDNARAFQLLLECQHYDGFNKNHTLDNYLERYWQFMVDSQTPTGQFRNFRSPAGEWLDESGTEDTQARVARALATNIRYDQNNLSRQQQVRDMLNNLLPHLQAFSHPRSIAEAIIALANIQKSNRRQAVLNSLWEKLWDQWQKNASANWPWPDKQLTYASALLPHGLLIGATTLDRLRDSTVSSNIKNSVHFLINLTTRQNYFWPIGTNGWCQQCRPPSHYDQQPTEAHTMLDLLLSYNRLMNNQLPETVIRMPYRWFTGQNSQHISIIDSRRGACYDGLTPQGANQNQGAESLLAYLRSELLLAHRPY